MASILEEMLYEKKDEIEEHDGKVKYLKMGSKYFNIKGWFKKNGKLSSIDITLSLDGVILTPLSIEYIFDSLAKSSYYKIGIEDNKNPDRLRFSLVTSRYDIIYRVTNSTEGYISIEYLSLIRDVLDVLGIKYDEEEIEDNIEIKVRDHQWFRKVNPRTLSVVYDMVVSEGLDIVLYSPGIYISQSHYKTIYDYNTNLYLSLESDDVRKLEDIIKYIGIFNPLILNEEFKVDYRTFIEFDELKKKNGNTNTIIVKK